MGGETEFGVTRRAARKCSVSWIKASESTTSGNRAPLRGRPRPARRSPSDAATGGHRAAVEDKYLVRRSPRRQPVFRSRPSPLQGGDRLANKANPATEAENTEYASADFAPVPTHMPRAKRRSTMPLKRPAKRGRKPSTSAIPRTVSAAVASQASTGITAGGAHGLSCAV